MRIAGTSIPDSNQANILRAFAPLCPIEYGRSIFIARAALTAVDNTRYISSCEMRGTRHGIKNTSSVLSATVYPNPANSLLNIEVSLGNGQSDNICRQRSLLWSIISPLA